MTDLQHLLTPRLRLDAVVAGDLDEHHALLSDPGGWAHLPSGRHTDRATTADTLDLGLEQWARAGLGHWTARLRGCASTCPGRR